MGTETTTKLRTDAGDTYGECVTIVDPIGHEEVTLWGPEPLHKHDHSEVFTVLEGEGIALVDGEEIPIGVGSEINVLAKGYHALSPMPISGRLIVVRTAHPPASTLELSIGQRWAENMLVK